MDKSIPLQGYSSIVDTAGFLKLVKDLGDDKKRALATRYMRGIGPDDTDLLAVLHENATAKGIKNVLVREIACRIIGQIQSKGSIEPLALIIENDQEETSVRHMAVKAIKRIRRSNT